MFAEEIFGRCMIHVKKKKKKRENVFFTLFLC